MTEKINIEKEAVNTFLKSQGKSFIESSAIFPHDDYADVKYQITTAPAPLEEVCGRLNKESKVVSSQNDKVKGEMISINGESSKCFWYDFTLLKHGNTMWKNPFVAKRKTTGKYQLPRKLFF